MIFSGIKELARLVSNRKGDLPGWAFVIGLILGLFAIIFLLYLAYRSGQATIAPLKGGLRP